MIAGMERTAETKNTKQIAFVNRICVTTGRFAEPITNRFIISSSGIMPINSGMAIVMEITMPVLLKNARMDEAKPRRSTGTAAMIALVFGGWKSPDPNPWTNIQDASTQYGVSYCMKASPASPTVEMMSPAVLISREPYLSERDPRAAR